MVKIFISHIADEAIEANSMKDVLEKTFPKEVEVFLASSWDSIAPGEDWFKKIEAAIDSCDVMVILCSTESVSRPWILFETGAAWFSRKKLIPICHRGMTPSALPEPIKRLQAVDINAKTSSESLSKFIDAITTTANLPTPAPVAVEEAPPQLAPQTLGAPGPIAGGASLRGWLLRPAQHIGEFIEGTFRVGDVLPVDVARANEAGIDPTDAVYVRLFVEPSLSDITFLNTMAAGKVANIFEDYTITGKKISAKLILKAVHTSGPQSVPIIAIESARLSGTN